MKIDLNNFEKHDADIFDLTIVPLDNDIGGGRVTKEEIDIIRQYPDAKSLRISGLNQETFEYLISNYGCQFEAISFFKNKLVSNLSLLGNLRNIKYIHYFFNQKASELWDMRSNYSLTGLAIYDFSRLHTIDKITAAPNLKYFAIGDRVWDGTRIESLKPLINSNITHFAWWGKEVQDNDFLCLSGSRINELDLNICQFEMKELARLIAAIPGLKGTALKPYREAKIVESRGTTTFYFLCKGKRKLIKGKDDAKLEKYILEFEEMVERFRDKETVGEDIL